jgi:hypothetical protein
MFALAVAHVGLGHRIASIVICAATFRRSHIGAISRRGELKTSGECRLSLSRDVVMGSRRAWPRDSGRLLQL